MDILDGMLQRDKDDFSRICNRLLSSCFLCKRNKTNKADYYFVIKYKEKFSDCFALLGYRLEINEEYGVIQLTNPQNYNRYNMKLFESILLLILRILYDVIVNVGDIHDIFLSLKIRDKMIDKTTFRNAISTLKRFQIIETLDSNLTDEDARIIIFDAILMAVRVEDIKTAYEKLEIYRKGGKDSEEADESEAD